MSDAAAVWCSALRRHVYLCTCLVSPTGLLLTDRLHDEQLSCLFVYISVPSRPATHSTTVLSLSIRLWLFLSQDDDVQRRLRARLPPEPHLFSHGERGSAEKARGGQRPFPDSESQPGVLRVCFPEPSM